MKYMYMTEKEQELPYYQFPKFLLEMNLSQNARVIYTLLYDRGRLSRKNRWTDEDGTVWTLVSIPSSDVDDIFALAANDYRSKLEERRLDIEARYMALLEELSSSASADAEAIAKAALDYISDEVSAIDDVLRGISEEDIAGIAELLMRDDQDKR